MVKELEVDPTFLEPPLLDGNESHLIDDYFSLVSKKMDEWTANLMKTEVDDFVKRENQPEEDADGYYSMQGAVILFQMLNQQVDLALDSNQAAVLARVIDEANRVMRGVQTQWLKLLDQEYRKQITAQDKGTDDMVGGLVEYVMALANDQIKSADFTEALNNRLEPLVSNKYKVQLADKLNDAMDGFLDVAKRCVQVLIDVVFHDLRPATKLLLQPGSTWYTASILPLGKTRAAEEQQGPMEQIILTLKDYMVEDYQAHLNPNLFDLLIEDILDTFLITYLVAVRKAGKLKIPQAVDRMRADVDMAVEFFGQYKSRKELEGYFDVLESVLTLMSASKMMVFLDVRPLFLLPPFFPFPSIFPVHLPSLHVLTPSPLSTQYWPFRKKYGANLAFTETLMKAREDLDRSAVNDIMESVKRKVNSEVVDAPEQPSIFERMPAK